VSQHYCHLVCQGFEVSLEAEHIKRCYHFMQDAIKTKDVTIKYIPTIKIIVDSLTKPIPRDAFDTHILSTRLRKV